MTSAKNISFIKIMSLFLVLALSISLFSIDTGAASKKYDKSISVAVGETRTFKVNTEDKVTWKSDNKSIATVKSGKITGKKTGTAYVTATYGKKKLTYKVKVVATRFVLSSDSVRIGEKLKLKLAGDIGNNKLKWRSTDEDVFTVNQKGEVTPHAAGTADVVVTYGKKEKRTPISVLPEINDSGDTLTIWSYNTEFEEAFKKYYPDYEKTGYIGDVEVEFVYSDFLKSDYVKKLDKALLSGREDVDLFIMEETDIQTYGFEDGDFRFTLSMEDIGITDKDTKYMCNYTKEIGSYDGRLKAAAWNLAPGGFAYRRSIAKKVLGTDDPDEVQKYLSDWTRFKQTAKKMSDEGYYMISNSYVMMKPFFYRNYDRFVKDGKLQFSEGMEEWIETSKYLYDNNCCSGSYPWSYEWSSEMTETDTVFGRFVASWYLDFTLPSNALYYPTDEENSTSGDWGFCEGPENFIWGGSYICVGGNCDNMSLSADVIRKLCCDTKNTTKMATGGEMIYPNNTKALKKMAEKFDENEFFGGQNTVAVLADVAKKMDVDGGLSFYDGVIMYNGGYEAFENYFRGDMTYEEAYEVYVETVRVESPELIK